MDKLRQTMLDVKDRLGSLADALEAGKLLAEGAIFELISAVDTLRREQQRCVAQITERVGCQPEECESLAHMEALLAAYMDSRRLEQLRQVAADFAAITGDGPFGDALREYQQKLLAMSAEELLKLDDRDGLEPYRRMTEMVEWPKVELNDTLPLYGIFGAQVAYGLMLKSYTRGEPVCLQPMEEMTAAARTEKETDPVPVKEPEKEEKQEPVKEPEREEKQEPVKEPEREEKQEPAKEPEKEEKQLPAKEAENGPEQPLPAEPVEPVMDFPTVAVGKLITVVSDRKPKGESALLSRIKKSSPEAVDAMKQLCGYLLTNWCCRESHLRRLVCSTQSPKVVDQVLSFLYRESYICSHHLDGEDRKERFLRLTRNGHQILIQETIQRKLFDTVRRFGFPEIPHAGVFARLRRVRMLAEQTESWGHVSTLCSMEAGFAGWSLTANGADRMGICVLPLRYTDQDTPRNLYQFLEHFKCSHPPIGADTCLLAEVPDGQQTFWRTFLEQALSDKARCYLGVFGADRYLDRNGETHTLAELLAPFAPAEAAAESADAAQELTAVDGPEVSDGPAEPVDPVQADNAVAALAADVLKQPDPLKCTEQLKTLILDQVLHGEIMEAMVLAKTLADTGSDEWFERCFQHLLHGSNLLMEGREFVQYMCNEDLDALAQYCRLSAAFWEAAFPRNCRDNITYINISTMVEPGMDRMLPPELECLKQAMSLLIDELKVLSFDQGGDGYGLSAAVLSSLVSGSDLEEKRQDVMSRARMMADAPRSSLAVHGLQKLMDSTMGPEGELGIYMREIAAGRGYGQIQPVLGRFINSDDNIADERINAYIDDQWTSMCDADSSIQIRRLKDTSTARKLLAKEIRRRVEIIKEWLERNARSEGGIGGFKHDAFRSLVSRLEALLQQAVGVIGSLPKAGENGAGLMVLDHTLKGMLAVIRGERNVYQDPRVVFAPLLTAGYMLLDDGGAPILDRSLNDMPGMEPWRMMLRHIAAPKTSLEQALVQLEDFEQFSQRYEDYVSAANIRAVLKMEPADYSLKGKYALQDCEEIASAFRGDVRLACAYGRISEEAKETLLDQLARYRPLFLPVCGEETEQHERYYAGGHYAHFRMLHDCLLAQLEAIKEQNRAHFQAMYQERVRRCGEGDLPAILVKAKQEIDNDNYSMVEEYLAEFDSGKLVPAEEYSYTEEFDFHAQFVSCAQWYCSQCELPEFKGRNPREWGYRVLQTGNLSLSADEQKGPKAVLNSWLTQRGDAQTPTYVKNFLKLLGMNVTGVEKATDVHSGSRYEVFTIQVAPAEAGRDNYPHPVAKFGTMQASPMNVVCLYGCRGSATLIDIMTKKLQLSGSTIVLMDGALTMLERRRVAATLFETFSSFLVIDRVLMLYLAAQHPDNRLKAMLQCTLPYSYEQLYFEGAGQVADEMFSGRLADLNSLCHQEGACLVYGGRQLGKTALLRRAASINHKPAGNMYAIYVSIKDEGSDALLRELKRGLAELNVKGKKIITGAESSLEEICHSIDKNCGRFERLTVLVDEVDTYFEEIAGSNYSALNPITLLPSKVKFVFAGTYNVAATDKGISGNAELVKLRQPLCIKPLSAADAIALIKRPLSYLGFDIGDQQAALILANTNRYPGLIHLFCNALIKSIYKNYSKYYEGDTDCPPYTVSDDQLRTIFEETDLKKQIETRVLATITLDPKYSAVAKLLAVLERQDQENGTSRIYGYTPAEVQACNAQASQHGVCMPAQMSVGNLEALMDEMEKMGILWKNTRTGSYRFRQRVFLDYIYNLEKVERDLSGGEP